jgi:hypothetical protein
MAQFKLGINHDFPLVDTRIWWSRGYKPDLERNNIIIIS